MGINNGAQTLLTEAECIIIVIGNNDVCVLSVFGIDISVTFSKPA